LKNEVANIAGAARFKEGRVDQTGLQRLLPRKDTGNRKEILRGGEATYQDVQQSTSSGKVKKKLLASAKVLDRCFSTKRNADGKVVGDLKL